MESAWLHCDCVFQMLSIVRIYVCLCAFVMQRVGLIVFEDVRERWKRLLSLRPPPCYHALPFCLIRSQLTRRLSTLRLASPHVHNMFCKTTVCVLDTLVVHTPWFHVKRVSGKRVVHSVTVIQNVTRIKIPKCLNSNWKQIFLLVIMAHHYFLYS